RCASGPDFPRCSKEYRRGLRPAWHGSDSARLVPDGRNNPLGLARLAPDGRIPGLDLEDLVFLAVRKRVHALDLAVEQLLEPGLRALRVVLRHLTGLGHGVDAV